MNTEQKPEERIITTRLTVGMHHGVSILVATRGQFSGEYLFALAERIDPFMWEFPGGRVEIELNEFPRDAAARELAEETGLQFNPADLLYVGTTPREVPGYRCNYIGHRYGYVLQGDQIDQLRQTEPHKRGAWLWFSLEEVMMLPMLAAQKLYVCRFVDMLTR